MNTILHHLERFSRLMNRSFPLLAIAVSLLAFAHPPSLTWVLKHVGLFLGIIMFGMGLTLNTKDFKMLAEQPLAVFLGVAMQFTLMPLSAYALTLILPLPPEIALGVILVGACPGGTASNVMTYLARGNVALSVAVTAVSTLLAPLLTPLIFYALAHHNLEIALQPMMQSIMNIVFWPVISGFILNRFFHHHIRRVEALFAPMSIIFIVLIIGGVVGANKNNILNNGLLIFLAVILHNSLGLALGFIVARCFKLPFSMQKTLAIEVGMQNSGLAVTLAKTHLALFPAATVPAALFSLWHNLSGSALAAYWAERHQNDEPQGVSHE